VAVIAAILFSAALSTSTPVVPDLDARLARWKRVEMPFTMEGFTPREKILVNELVAACRELEGIYWRQIDPQDIPLYRKLRASKDAEDQNLARFLWINGGRWDLLASNEPFIGRDPMPPGNALYPKGITREEIEAYVKAHPEQKDAIYGERTVVALVSRSPLKLKTTPYHVAYRQWLERAAQHLRKAAAASDDRAFAKFLRDRATALLTDDYYKSDLEWVQLDNPKFDIIFAPYETFLDNLLGVKSTYGGAVMIRNEEESAKLAVFEKYVPDIQESLPLAPEDRPSKKGRASPMEVMDTPFRASDLRHGYQAVADNLPNDPRVHVKVGSKHIFFKNFMDARVNDVILPVAQRVMKPETAAKASASGYLTAVMLHEICHGLGPAYARRDGKQLDIREALGPASSALEEAKADVTGMFALQWLVDHGALPKERLPEFYASYVAGIFRSIRFGVAEPHSRAEMVEFNYLAERGAVIRMDDGRYDVVDAKIPAAIASLAKELLEAEATGDRARAEALFARYDKMPPELKQSLERARDVPVDIDPVGPFREGIR
jgi:Peptidase family M49